MASTVFLRSTFTALKLEKEFPHKQQQSHHTLIEKKWLKALQKDKLPLWQLYLFFFSSLATSPNSMFSLLSSKNPLSEKLDSRNMEKATLSIVEFWRPNCFPFRMMVIFPRRLLMGNWRYIKYHTQRFMTPQLQELILGAVKGTEGPVSKSPIFGLDFGR